MSISHYTVYLGAVIATGFLSPASIAQDRVLEEIIVTAQRREQSIQEVPISLEAYSGDVLQREGLRSMMDLSNFSPSTEINVRTQDQSVSVRGIGTSGRNPGMEQAVPVFVDGVHYGRISMIMGAFLDVDQIEVLRGPQPVAFGMNATAGAFSLTTKKPGLEWQGDVTAEYGNFGRTSVAGGIGGPITDTLGIRVAGQWDTFDGFIRDILTDDMFPQSEETGTRATLQWAPAENFEATLKAEYVTRDRNGDGNAMCRTRHPMALNERAMVVPGLTSFDNMVNVAPIPEDCDKGFRRVGLREAGTITYDPIPGIYQEDNRTGILNINSMMTALYAVPEAIDNMHAYNYRLGLHYAFDNEITVDAITGYVDYQRHTYYNNKNSPVVTNIQTLGEIFNMLSQEVRVLSPRSGMIEWEAGVFFQQEDFDAGDPFGNKYTSQTTRANISQPVRISYGWQDTTWMSAFGSITYNFLGDKASIDVGARYTDIDKDSHVESFARTWIFNINPIDPLTGRADSTNLDGTVRNVASSIINCATGHLFCGNYGAGYWTAQWRANDIPNAWNTQSPVAAGPLFNGIRDSDVRYDHNYKDSNLDPQLTLRYRFNDDLSVYGKWARAFKGGGADITSGGLPASQDAFVLAPEYAENFEIGAKGSLLDGRAMFNATLFTISIKDMQLETNVPTELGAGRAVTNAGKQRTRGFEFDFTWAATDRLTAGLSGALMDGVMLSYPGAGCTDFEFENAASGPCLTAAESITQFGVNTFQGTIDRSGYDAPRTPDWKFVLDLEYWLPVFDSHKVSFSTKTTFSDGWLQNVRDFSLARNYDQRTIANLNVGYGDLDDTWNLTFWVRNLLGRSQGLKYFPEFDPTRSTFSPTSFRGQYGIIDTDATTRDYTTYGVQFSYNYN